MILKRLRVQIKTWKLGRRGRERREGSELHAKYTVSNGKQVVGPYYHMYKAGCKQQWIGQWLVDVLMEGIGSNLQRTL